MLLATHALAGAIIGNLVNNAFIAFLLGLISHFLIDAIPHLDFPKYKKGNDMKKLKYNGKPLSKFQFNLILLNIILSVLALIYLFLRGENTAPYVMGILGAVIIDIPDDFPFLNEKYKNTAPFKYIYNFHMKIQTIQPPKSIGIFTQYITGLILLIILLKINV